MAIPLFFSSYVTNAIEKAPGESKGGSIQGRKHRFEIKDS